MLVQDGKILVQRERNGNECALPGGHVKIGETLEEMGVRIECKQMLWSVECFWEWEGGEQYCILLFGRTMWRIGCSKQWRICFAQG